MKTRTTTDFFAALGELANLVSVLEEMEVFEPGESNALESAKECLTRYGIKGYEPHPLKEV